MIKKICINCSSNYGANKLYKHEAVKVGRYLAKNNITVIYGGANVGLMGEVANAALGENGRVIGVITKAIKNKVGRNQLTELYVVDTMHERKSKMFDLSDGFIALPGGFGTLEEMFELLTRSQLGLNNKPCGLLNIADYYDKLIDFLDFSVKEKFIRAEHRKMIMVNKNIESLIEKFHEYKPTTVEKWIK